MAVLTAHSSFRAQSRVHCRQKRTLKFFGGANNLIIKTRRRAFDRTKKKNYMRTKDNSRSSASGRIDGRENEKSMIVVYLYYIDGWNIGNKLKSIQEALLQHTLILNNLRSNKWIFIILISLSIVINLYHSFLLLRRQRQTRRKEKKKRARVKEWSKKILKRQHQLVVWKINHWFVMNIKRSLKQQLRTQNKKLKRNQPNNSDLVHLKIKKNEYHVMINKLSARN